METQTLEQLKAKAYDLLAAIEAYQGELQRVNGEIRRLQAIDREQKELEDKPEDKPKK